MRNLEIVINSGCKPPGNNVIMQVAELTMAPRIVSNLEEDNARGHNIPVHNTLCQTY